MVKAKMNFSDIKKEYDLVVIGGGITGAGVFHEAVKRGYNTLLVEAEDFAWGTSSRSSKMVHGGLRYLKQGKFLLTKAAVKERQLLLKQYPGLVTPLKFIMPLYDNYGPSGLSMKTGLSIYSFLAGEKQHRTYTKAETLKEISGIRQKNLVSAVGFKDAQVDDARLVLRLIHEACLQGGTALNYTKAMGIERDKINRVAALNIKDKKSCATAEIKTKVIINATGAFAEKIHPSSIKGFHIRPLRGSHLVFPKNLFPLDRVISFIHPEDSRPVFLFPFEDSIILGTTDIDHNQDMKKEPFVTILETEYLMEGVKHVLPGINLSFNKCVSSFAGIRPVLSKKKKTATKASRESREHVVWKDKGLVTITGGKLTTFRLLARDALKAAEHDLPGHIFNKDRSTMQTNEYSQTIKDIPTSSQKRLFNRYGSVANQIKYKYDKKLFSRVNNTETLWVELCHGAENENIHHLSDLLLRRTRIGLFLQKGGKDLLNRIETVCTPFLSWDSEKWDMEKKSYIETWNKYYSPPHKDKEL